MLHTHRPTLRGARKKPRNPNALTPRERLGMIPVLAGFFLTAASELWAAALGVALLCIGAGILNYIPAKEERIEKE